jgi:hypothetical protein
MDIAATTSAWVNARRVPRPRKVVDPMAHAEALRQIQIPMANAAPENAMARAHAMQRLSPKPRMVRLVSRARNVNRDIVRMEYVATVGVWGVVKPARLRKKAAVVMARVGSSNTIPIPMKNAGEVHAMAKARVGNTMGRSVRPIRNVCRIFVSMAFAAETFARARVRRARQSRRAVVSTELVD